MELLTIIIRSIQFLLSFFLIAAVISFVAIKIKTRKRKQRSLNFSIQEEDVITMAERISTKVDHELELNRNNTIMSNDKLDARIRAQRIRNKIYAVYNPERNPKYYLHNHLNWYKNFN